MTEILKDIIDSRIQQWAESVFQKKVYHWGCLNKHSQQSNVLLTDVLMVLKVRELLVIPAMGEHNIANTTFSVISIVTMNGRSLPGRATPPIDHAI